jgi:hypothetical protein
VLTCGEATTCAAVVEQNDKYNTKPSLRAPKVLHTKNLSHFHGFAPINRRRPQQAQWAMSAPIVRFINRQDHASFAIPTQIPIWQRISVTWERAYNSASCLLGAGQRMRFLSAQQGNLTKAAATNFSVRQEWAKDSCVDEQNTRAIRDLNNGRSED